MWCLTKKLQVLFALLHSEMLLLDIVKKTKQKKKKKHKQIYSEF